MHTSPARPEAYRSWLVGELCLVGLLGAATAYFALRSSLGAYALPQARLALDTAVAVCATIVAILASVRFLVEGRIETRDGETIPLSADSICVHGDGATAPAVVRTIRDVLVECDVRPQPATGPRATARPRA